MREKHKIHETACVIKATNQVTLYVEEGLVSPQKQKKRVPGAYIVNAIEFSKR
jgi:hypothetical protein